MDDLVAFLTARLDELQQKIDDADMRGDQYTPWGPDVLEGDIAAKRKLIAWALDDDYPGLTPIRADGMINGEWGSGDIDSPELTEQLLKLLAEPFAWHRDYRPEWRA